MVDQSVQVSVVLPVGRVDELLGQQLDSLVGQQDAPTWELVCSLNTDDRQEAAALQSMLDTRPSLVSKVVDSSSMRSASHARNVGADNSNGEYLIFCDGDDIADPRWMRSMVEALSNHDAVGGHLDEEMLAVAGQEQWRPPATPGKLPTFLSHPFIVSANMGVRRRLFHDVGGFDTSLIRGEDIAFSWALIDHGVEMAYAPEAVVHYRHRKGLIPMMRQHYLYGLGFSQILAGRGLPDGETQTGIRALKPNSQQVSKRSVVHFIRRGSIAAGRIVGLVKHRRLHLGTSGR